MQKSRRNRTCRRKCKTSLKVAADKRNEPQQKQLRDYFLQHVYPTTKPEFEAISKQIADLTAQKTDAR